MFSVSLNTIIISKYKKLKNFRVKIVSEIGDIALNLYWGILSQCRPGQEPEQKDLS